MPPAIIAKHKRTKSGLYARIAIVLANITIAPPTLHSIDNFFGSRGKTTKPLIIAPKPKQPTNIPKPVELRCRSCLVSIGNNAINALPKIENAKSRTNKPWMCGE